MFPLSPENRKSIPKFLSGKKLFKLEMCPKHMDAPASYLG